MGRIRKAAEGVVKRVDYATELPSGKFKLHLVCGHSVTVYRDKQNQRTARCKQCLT